MCCAHSRSLVPSGWYLSVGGKDVSNKPHLELNKPSQELKLQESKRNGSNEIFQEIDNSQVSYIGSNLL